MRTVSAGGSRIQVTQGLDQPETPGPDQMRGLVEAAFDAALSLDPDIETLEVRLQGQERHVLIASSDLPAALTHTTWTGIRVEAGKFRSGRPYASHAIGGGPGSLDQFLLHAPEDIARECVARLEAITESETELHGEMPVVIAGGWGGAWLHEAVGHLLEADIAPSGPYSVDHIGRRVARVGITIIDGGPGSDVDHEGIAAGPTTLIQDGVLTALMTDRLRAGVFGLPLTGNGFRQDYRHEPLPRMTGLFLQAGSDSPERLIGDVSSGLYVRLITHGRVHPGEDRFSFDVAEGYRIDKGRLGRAVTGVRVSGKVSDVLLNVEGIADDLAFDAARGVCVKHGQRVFVSAGMPTVLVNKLSIEPITNEPAV